MGMPRRGWKRPPRADLKCAQLMLKLQREQRRKQQDSSQEGDARGHDVNSHKEARQGSG